MTQAILSRVYDQIDQTTDRTTHFVSTNNQLEAMVTKAYVQLAQCIKDHGNGKPVLHEGGIYHGTWLESTGTINAEILSRFLPDIAQHTFEQFATHQRADGLIPYKVTPDGPNYRQIQFVSPLALSVWTHYQLNGRDKAFLKKMYDTMVKYDTWLTTYRNTRQTGCVEAFSTFDTGHDRSPRFWHAPDVPHTGDATQCHPDSPHLPFLAPDLTANVYCQRLYLAKIAIELGDTTHDWLALADGSLQSLMEYCYHKDDHFFYDLDRNHQHVKVQSDVLLRVLACEVGDDAFFKEALSRYLLNTKKFFSAYPFTSIALDDPRFDPTSTAYNSWSGTSNFLSLIRAPHAFEAHGHYVELSWVLQPILSAFSHMDRFPQTLHPWTGEAGFTDVYSPSILCLLDYIERLSGILPRPDGELWITGLTPYPFHQEHEQHEVAYSKHHNDHEYVLTHINEACKLYKDREELATFPAGIRLILNEVDQTISIVGMSVRTIKGTLTYQQTDYPFQIEGNEIQTLQAGAWVTTKSPGIVSPTYE